MNGAAKFHVVGNITNRFNGKSFFPNRALPYPSAEFIADKLDRHFCGRDVHRRHECLKLVWKNRELMQQIFSLFTKSAGAPRAKSLDWDPTGKSADCSALWRCKTLA
jgi:hypothetical protein